MNSLGIPERRKQIRTIISAYQALWKSILRPQKKQEYINLIRQAHILRMMGVPTTFPDGRRLPLVAQAARRPRRKTDGKGDSRRYIRNR